MLPAYTRAAGARRMFELLRLLSEQGHAVTFVAADPSDGPRFADELRRLGIETYAGDPERALLLGRSIDAPHLDLGELLAGTDFDLALLSLWYVAERYLELVRRHAPRARVVVDTVDVHFVREQRHAELERDPMLARGAAETRVRELAVYAEADSLVAVTEDDADAIRAELPAATVHIVSIIHDVSDGAPGAAGRDGLLFVGNFLHKPNPDAVAWLHREVMPLVWAEEPGARLTIAGFRPTAEVKALAGPLVDVVGEVPAMEPLLDAHRISVAPLRFGAGIKGKVCEALAAGIPVVTTSVGTEGMGLAPGSEVLLEADDPAAYAAAIVALLRDDALWTRLADGGRRHIDEHLSSRAAGERLAQLVASRARAQGRCRADVDRRARGRSARADRGVSRLDRRAHARAVRDRARRQRLRLRGRRSVRRAGRPSATTSASSATRSTSASQPATTRASRSPAAARRCCSTTTRS